MRNMDCDRCKDVKEVLENTIDILKRISNLFPEDGDSTSKRVIRRADCKCDIPCFDPISEER